MTNIWWKFLFLIFVVTVVLPLGVYFVNFMAYVWFDPFLTKEFGAKLFTSIMVGLVITGGGTGVTSGR